ncbi:MAG: hypothetical protein ACK5RO_11085 [Pseudobdellovibrionaceae bacterium]
MWWSNDDGCFSKVNAIQRIYADGGYSEAVGMVLLEIYSETPRGLEHLEQMRRERAAGSKSAGDASPLQLARNQVEVHGSFYFQ